MEAKSRLLEIKTFDKLGKGKSPKTIGVDGCLLINFLNQVVWKQCTCGPTAVSHMVGCGSGRGGRAHMGTE